MAKLKCRLVSIYAPIYEREAVLERLQEMSVIDIDTAASDDVTAKAPDGFEIIDNVKIIEEYERNAQLAEEALKILNSRFPEKKGLSGIFSGPRSVAKNDFYLSEENKAEIISESSDITACERRISEEKAEIVRLNTAREQLLPWRTLDLPLSFAGTAKTAAFIGTVAGEYTLETLYEKLALEAPDLIMHAEIINTIKGLTYIFACCPTGQKENAEAVLRVLSFARPLQLTEKPPEEEIRSIEEKTKEYEKHITEFTERIRVLADKRHDIELLYDYSVTKAENCRILGETSESKHTALIKGYIAERDIPYLEKSLKKRFTVVIESTEADDELAPVKLKNGPFSAPAESLVKMYSLPSAQDIDPTPLTGFFYYLFFGMMFSDAGYGLLMIIATTFVLKKFKPSPSMRSSMKLFQYCGISTLLWGLVYGSFFGDSIAVISEAFFGKRVALPALIDPINGDAVTMLILSIALGFAEIIAGLCAKFVTYLKNGDKAGAFFDAGLWITALIGIALAAAGFALYAPLKNIGFAVAAASAVGLILTQGRGKKNPVMRIFSGIASLYDITGYVSDLLSFSRLMALGLTTSAMSAVFNMLGTMAGKSVAGIVLLIIIFPIGHAINFGLNVLGAYVHTLRLQYVELFSKFYEGGGRPFKAFSIKSKYVGIDSDNFKEEN